MRVIDLTLPIHSGMMTFPTHWHPMVEINILGRHGIEGRETRKLVLGTHTGTHMDAPLHFIEGGSAIDEAPLELFIGPATVVNLHPCAPLQKIEVEDLRKQLGDRVPPRLILRTDWSERFGRMEYYTHSPYLSERAAEWLVQGGVRLIAMDIASPDNPADSRGTAKDSPNHKAILGAGVYMVEYLCNLKALTRSEVELIVLPLKVKGGDGAPARCIAVER
jgi:kynurenine formamidase